MMAALPDPRRLAVQTLTDPAAVARTLIALKLPRAVLWQALLLVAVLQAAIYAVSLLFIHGPQPLDWLFGSPLQFLGIGLLAIVLFIHGIHLFGKMFGGKGSLEDVLVVMVWIQALRMAAQAVALPLSVTIPILALLLMVAALFIGFYITLHFIDQALRLNSLLIAFFVFLCASLVLVIGLAVFIPLTGGPPTGPISNV